MKTRVHHSVFLTIWTLLFNVLECEAGCFRQSIEASYQPSLSEVIETSNAPRIYQKCRSTSLFYLVNESSAFSGDDTLSLTRRTFETSRNVVASSGFYFNFGNFLLLWDRASSTYQFVGISALKDRTWKSCWAQTSGGWA